MRRNLVLLFLAFCIIAPLTAGSQKEWVKIQKEYQTFTKKPGYVVYDVNILVLHPMLKEADRTKNYSSEVTINWDGKRGTQVIVKNIAKKGQVKMLPVGTSSGFIYPHRALVAILQSKDIKFIEDSADRVVEGKACRVFKIQGVAVGDSKARFGFVNIDKASGEVVTIEFGAPVGDLNLENGAAEEMFNFFFTQNGGKRVLSRVANVKTSKSNDIPFIVTTDGHYSKFK